MSDAQVPRFQIHLSGRFRLVRDGQVVPERMIGSTKGRTLLKLLAIHAGNGVTVDRIVEILWGDAPPAKPQDNVATLVSRLRSVLDASVIEGGRHGTYSLVPGPSMEVDIYEAERLTEQGEARLANSEPTLARVAAERAVNLLGRGQLLEGEFDAPWAEDARQDATRVLRRARRCLWLAALELSDHRTALDAAVDAVRDDELDEEAYRAVMLAHFRAGDRAAALAAFDALRRVLAEELGADPSSETGALHVAILRNEDLPASSAESRRTLAGAMDPGFVGRDEEVDQLTKHWAKASAGSATLVLIIGEAGIGKSRLAAETVRLADATGGLVLHSRCYEAERSLFLQPLAEAIRSAVIALHPDETRAAAAEWAGPLGELVPEIAQIVKRPDYEAGPSELERRRAFEGITSFFQNLARKRPVLLFIDDLHLAAAATIELLHFMFRRLPRERLLVIGTVRQEESRRALEPLVEISNTLLLDRLPEDAVRLLARQADAADLADELMRRTRGHPLFVVEALRTMVEAPKSGRSITIPDSLRNAVVARTKRLGADTDSFLRAVVVLGSSFDIDLAAGLAGLSLQDALRHAERALEARLIVQAKDVYEFANDLIREVLYEATPRPTRIARHRQAASLMTHNPEAVAAHRAAAGEWKAAAEAWLKAGALAAGSFANRDAARLLGAAVGAASTAHDHVLVARSCLARSRVLETLGEYGDAYADASRALEIAQEQGDADLEAQALERLAWVAYAGRYDEGAHDLARQASEISARAVEAAGARPTATVLAARLKHSQGDLEGAKDLLEGVLGSELDDDTRAVALSSLGGALEHADRFEEAARTLTAAVALCRRVKSLRPLITGLFFAGMAWGNLGRFSDALRTFDNLGRLVEESDSLSYRPRVANCRSWIYRELGDIRRARDLAQEAAERADELREIEPKGHAALALTECSLLENDNDEAARLLQEAQALLAGREVGFSWRLELRRVELRSRLEPEHAHELLELAREHGSRKYEALAFAHLGRHEEALEIAAPLRSDYLTALVGEGTASRKAIDRLAAGLPAELRADFLSRGRLPLAVSGSGRQVR